jgi:hypothetical protein
VLCDSNLCYKVNICVVRSQFVSQDHNLCFKVKIGFLRLKYVL